MNKNTSIKNPVYIAILTALLVFLAIYTVKLYAEDSNQKLFLSNIKSASENSNSTFPLSKALGFEWDEVCVLQLADTSSRTVTTREFIRLHKAQYGHWTQKLPWILSPIDWITKIKPAHDLGLYVHEYAKAFIFFKDGTAIKVIKIMPPKDNLAIQVGDMSCQKDLNVRTDIFNSMPIFRFSK